MDINYEIGVIKTQIHSLQKSIDTLADTVDDLAEKVDLIDTQITTWRSTAVGAIFVLSVVGSVILYLSDGLVQFIKVKLGI
jgi:hypothetical protein